MAGGGCLFVEVGVMLVEGRLSGAGPGPGCGTREGSVAPPHHRCQDNSFLCERASKLKRHMSLLSENRVPMCIDVLLCPDCACGAARAGAANICSGPSPHDLLLEQWTVSLVGEGVGGTVRPIEGRALLQAVRSQLHFSQLGAWAALGKVPPVSYRLSHPGTAPKFARPPIHHHFPLATTSRPGLLLKVCVESLPRMESIPVVECPLHSVASPLSTTVTVFKSVFAELGHCLLDPPSKLPPPLKHGGGCWREKRTPSPPPRPPRSHRLCRPTVIPTRLVDDRLHSGCQHIGKHHCQDEDPPPPSCTNTNADKGCYGASTSSSVMKSLMSVGGFRPPALANSIISVFRSEVIEGKDRINPLKRKRQEGNTHSKKLQSEQTTADLTESFNLLKINDTLKPPHQAPHLPIKKHLLILPTTPPPCRRQVTDSSSEDTECESPVASHYTSRPPLSPVKPQLHLSRPLLGSLEESVLCGRLSSCSTVEGYTADLGASGAFCPRHLKLPVTVFFYPVQGLSAPYMGVVKLNKKGYHVPRSGTVQVTLLNPLGTVIKMFVVPYDLTDMPPNSHTFIRQRILANSLLRYLIHLRFSSSKSGRVFLHTDLRMIIARQYDTDASVEMDTESNCQLRSIIVAPDHPKYSTRK